MPKIRLHYGFILLLAVMSLTGRLADALSVLFVVTVHEYFHVIVASRRGYYLKKITLMPYGAVIFGYERLRQGDEWVIALAGPLSNICLSTILAALWWVFPVTYVFTEKLCLYSLVIGIFNLLPLYPLDGARIVLSKANDRMKAMRVLQVLGVGVAILLAVLFLYSAFYNINFTLGVMSLFLAYGALFSAKNEKYLYLSQLMLPSDDAVLEQKIYIVPPKVTLNELIRLSKPYTNVEFVLKGSPKTIITSGRLIELCDRFPGKTKLQDILKN